MKKLLLPLSLLVAAGGPAMAADAPAVPSVQHFMMGISVADMETMTAWYRDMLGFKVTKDLGGNLRFLENGSERIEMVHTAGSKPGEQRPLPPNSTIQGWVQLTMEVPDLDAARTALIARGVTPGAITPIPSLGIRIIFMRDPEGNIVELVQKLPAPK